MNAAYTEDYKGYTIEIYQDEFHETPSDSGDDSLFLVADHRQFYVKPPKNSTMQSVVGDFKKTHFVFGLEAYIHSGVCLALASEGNFPDRQWDVSQLGAVFVAKEHWNTRAKARKAALSLISEWNHNLSGNVWGFKVLDDEGNEVDSCWGFVGDYDNEEYGPVKEAKAIIEWHIENNKDNFLGQAI